MKDKIEIAKDLRRSKRNLTLTINNQDDIALLNKCYYQFVVKCIICNKNSFSITFKGKKLRSNWYMLKEWLRYFKEKITKSGSGLLPIQIKLSAGIHESLLYYFFEKSGLTVFESFPNSTDVIYKISIQ